MEELKGQIEQILFHNKDTAYTIAKIKVRGRPGTSTAIGNIVNPLKGSEVIMKGKWGRHQKYGLQFKIVSCELPVPTSLDGIASYLGSGLVKGIGKSTARRIVHEFKEETLNVLDNEIHKLIIIPSIGAKRIELIKKAWNEQKGISQVMIFLQSHNISPVFAAKIYKQFGNNAVRIVQDNPYRLANDIAGIGFATADKIAESLGITKDSVIRAEAGVLYTLTQLANSGGHVYYPLHLLLNICKDHLGIDSGVSMTAVQNLAAEKENKRIYLENVDNSSLGTSMAVYLAPFFIAEINVADRLKKLISLPRSISNIDARKAVDWVQKKLSVSLAQRQIEAVTRACNSKVLVITGGPGTGKTTAIGSIIKIFSEDKARTMLNAPTARAGKRMSEATGLEAKTIHRLLEYSIAKGGFQKDENTPLNCQLLIIDEASMIDTILMNHLLKAVPKGATFILVGDINQLPSVGAGSVLKDVIESGSVPVVNLDEIFRQAQGSDIIVNAHKVNQGIIPELDNSNGQASDFFFFEQDNPELIPSQIVALVKEKIPQFFGLNPIDDIQVITPMHDGSAGTKNLNMELQKALNPSGEGIAKAGRAFNVGDKVMQTVNDYDKDVFNGDIGRITRVDQEEHEIHVRFDDHEVKYDYGDLGDLVLAYAISIHKAQGSEYAAVVMPIEEQHYMMLQRNLLYTGITRGKKLVVVVGTKKAMAMAVRNNKISKRFTLLKQRLQR